MGIGDPFDKANVLEGGDISWILGGNISVGSMADTKSNDKYWLLVVVEEEEEEEMALGEMFCSPGRGNLGLSYMIEFQFCQYKREWKPNKTKKIKLREREDWVQLLYLSCLFFFFLYLVLRGLEMYMLGICW